MAFVQFTACIPSPNAGGDALERVRVRWAVAEVDGENESNMEGLEREVNRTAAGEWFGVIPFPSILGTVHVARAIIAVHRLLQSCREADTGFTLMASLESLR